MPPLNVAIRAAVAVAALGAGTTAGIATAAVHAKADAEVIACGWNILQALKVDGDTVFIGL